MIEQLGYLNERLAVAAAAAVINIALTLICTAYLVREMRTPGWRHWRSNQLALGIECHMVGESIRSTWGAVLLYIYANGSDIAAVENAYPLAFVGAMVSAAGVLCKIRVLSPEWMARRLWVVVMLVAFASGAGVIWEAPP